VPVCQSQLQKISRTFFLASCDMACLLIHRRGVPSIRADRSAAAVLFFFFFLEQVLARKTLAHPGFRAVARLRRYLRQLSRLSRADPTLQQVAGFEELLKQRLSLWCWSPDPWRTCQGWPTPGPFAEGW